MLKNYIFFGLAPISHQLNIIDGVCFDYFLAKVLVKTRGLRRASYFFSKLPKKGSFGYKIRSFEPSWMPKMPQSDPICIAIGVYYPLGVFEGHFELFSAISGAVVNFSQWRSCFWQFCVCHFGCLKNDIFWASLQLRTSWTLSMGSVLNIFSKGAWGNPGIKEGQLFFLENALNLDKVYHKK